MYYNGLGFTRTTNYMKRLLEAQRLAQEKAAAEGIVLPPDPVPIHPLPPAPNGPELPPLPPPYIPPPPPPVEFPIDEELPVLKPPVADIPEPVKAGFQLPGGLLPLLLIGGVALTLLRR